MLSPSVSQEIFANQAYLSIETEFLWMSLILSIATEIRFGWKVMLGIFPSKAMQRAYAFQISQISLENMEKNRISRGKWTFSTIESHIQPSETKWIYLSNSNVSPKLNSWCTISSSTHVSYISKWYHTSPTLPTRRLEVF